MRIYAIFDDKQRSAFIEHFEKEDKEYFKKMNANGYGIYFTPNDFDATQEEIDNLHARNIDEAKKKGKKNPPRPTKRNTEFVKKLVACYGDLDVSKEADHEPQDIIDSKKEQLKKDLEAHCPPTAIIWTKNGLQPLWKLKNAVISPEDIEKYLTIEKGIRFWSKANGCHGDAVQDIPRVIRLPGYYHMKGEPYMCKVLYKNDLSYTLDELLEKFPHKEEKKEQYNTKKHTDRTPEMLEIDKIDIRDIMKEAMMSIGRSVDFDSSDRAIIDGRLTGTFVSNEYENTISTTSGTSGDDVKGNPVTLVARVRGCTNSQAYEWIVTHPVWNIRKKVHEIEIDKKLETIEEEKPVVDQDPDSIEGDDGKRYSWGTYGMNQKFAPIKSDTYCIICGETGDGKTTLAFHMAIQNAKEHNHKVFYLSLEMSKAELWDSIATSYSGITEDEFYFKRIPQIKKEAHARKMSELKALKGITISDIARGQDMPMEIVEKMIKDSGCDIAFVDNFDLIEREQGLDENRAARKISKELMKLSALIRVPIMVLHHFRKNSPAPKFGKDKGGNDQEVDPIFRPLDDMGGSGKIGHDSTRVLQLMRRYKHGAPPESNAKTRLLLQKARGWSDKRAWSIYFYKGEFHEAYPPSLRAHTSEQDQSNS